MSKPNFKTELIILTVAFLFIATVAFTYLAALPAFVESQYVSGFLKKAVNQNLGWELEIINPKLTTRVHPSIDFSIDRLFLKKDETVLIQTDNFSTSIYFKNILDKKIKISYLKADTLILRLDKLIEALPEAKEQKEQPKSDWQLDLFNSSLGLNNLIISYYLNGNNILIDAKNIKITQQEGYKTLDFNTKIAVSKKGDNYLNIIIDALNEIKLMPDKLETNDLIIFLNNSKLKLTSKYQNKEIILNAKSDKFYLEDIFKIVSGNLIIPDGESLLLPLVQPKGQIGCDINMKNNVISGDTELSGSININNTGVLIKDLSKLPLNVQKGKLLITKEKIDFVDLVGYYGKNKSNGIKIYGTITDYFKSMDSDITVDTRISNEFFKDYLSKLINNTILHTTSPIGTRIIYKSKYNIMDITWLAKISKGVDFGLDDSKSALSDYDRAVKGDFHIEKDKLTIKNINYYIAPDIHKGVKIKPILTLDGNMDLAGNIDKIGFSLQEKCLANF